MGKYCCRCFLTEDERSAIAINKEIQHILAEQRKRERREIKLLLLGTGESGKTTFTKQMRIIHGKGFSTDERRSYTKLIFQNIFQAMRAITEAMNTLKIPYSNPQNEVYAQWFQDLDIHQITQLQRNYVEAIRHLWEDIGIKICYGRRREYQLLDSTKYFIGDLDRITAEGYIPTIQDILQVRFPTSGIIDYCFELERITLRIVDVGGQRGQRKKWIHCFENVTSLIFLASMSEYDQLLEENNKDNRMQESLSLFYTTIHSMWFANSSVILFLNKKDILAEKIQFSDLKTYFPEFEGARRDVQDAMDFIRSLYIQNAVSYETKNSKQIFSHFTCATDTKNIRKVFDNVKDTVLVKNHMEESLSLFYMTIHSTWLAHSSVILFLNKMDILAEKIQFSDLETYFPEFEGTRRDDQDAKQFIRVLYKQKAVSKENSSYIYSHFIFATEYIDGQILPNVLTYSISVGEMKYYCGCCTYFLPEDERNAIAINKEIQHILAKQRKKERSEIKLLLLGTGESGKTTFTKQMRIIHGKGFSTDERRSYTKLIFQNIFQAMRAITEAMNTLKIPYSNPQNEVYAQWFQDLDIHQITQLQRNYVEAIRHLWEDKAIKICYGRRREYQLLDSTKYFIGDLDRITSEGYIPTNQDILQVRFPTSGIIDYCFELEKMTLRIVDVGGQRGQRKKWIHCFENVTSLIFLASMSEYDQLLEENNKDNRMQESLSLFYTTIHSMWFANSSVILFLNKKDILAEKIQFSDLKTYFPEFKGKRRDVQDAMDFIRSLYIQNAVSYETKNSKKMYSHFTCATDTNNIRKVFSDVKDVVLVDSLEGIGVI